MFDINKSLTIDADYKIRKEKFGAILFHRPTLGISKTTNFVFEIYNQIDKHHYSAKKLLEVFNIKDKDKEPFIQFLSNLYADGGIKYGTKRMTNFKQVFSKIDNDLTFQAPNMVWWDITSACNLKCYYCYSSSGCKKPDELSFDEVTKIIDQLSEMGVFYIYFLGGEPFMKEHFLDILDYTYNAGLGIMITTNGTLITEEIADKLKNVSNIRISLDSADAEIHNKMRGRNFSYDKCINALKILSKLHINNFGINSTIGPDNYKNLKDLYNIALKYNCDIIQMIPVCGSGRASENEIGLTEFQRKNVLKQMKSIQQEIKTKHYKTQIDAPEGYVEKFFEKDLNKNKITPDLMGCSAGKTCLALQQNGQVGYCLMCREPLGNLRKEKFKAIFRKAQTNSQRNKKQFCQNCKHNDICYGPCMVNGNTCDCDDERLEVVNKYLCSK